MVSFTRRAVLRALPALAVGSAGCVGLVDDDALPTATTWQRDVDDPTSGVLPPDGPLVVGSSSPFSSDPLLVALDPGTGDLLWELDGEAAREASPVGADDRFAYVFSRAEPLTAVDHDSGETVWQEPLPGVDAPDPGTTDFAPMPVAERVVVPVSGVEDDTPDRLTGFDRETGERRFRHELPASIAAAPAVTDDGAGVVVPTLDGSLHRVTLDGSEQWRLDVGATLSAVTVHDGTVYLGSATEEVLAVDATTGERRWTGELENTVFTRPLVADGTVYVGGADYYVSAFDADDGTRQWRAETSNAVTDGPVLAGENVVTLVGSRRRVRGTSGTIPNRPTGLFVHDTDGRRLAHHPFEGYVDGGQVRWVSATDDGVYLGQQNRVNRLAPEVFADA